jgi:hypothetical protein
MGRYITRYKKEHYVRKDIRKDIYEKLIEWCSEPSINSCLEKVLNALPRNIGGNIPGEYSGGIYRGNMELGNPIDYVESRVTPSRKCVATKVGKSYLVECEDGARAFIPSNAIPDLVERFGLVVREG